MINRALSLFLINYFSNGGKGEHRGSFLGSGYLYNIGCLLA
jgi:hypothetical protein